MLVLPAIDIKGGKCVRLYRGKADRETVYSDDPETVARRWEREGAEFLHLVDLDGAFRGEPANLDIILRIVSLVTIPVQAGGGFRSPESIERALSAGTARVIVGSRAAISPDFMRDLFRSFENRILPSIDAREGRVMIKGWMEESELEAAALGKTLKKIGFKTAVYTDTTVDGTLEGPNLAALEEFLEATGLAVIAAGGVAERADIVKLKRLEGKGLAGVIAGKALYEGRLSLAEAIQAARA